MSFRDSEQVEIASGNATVLDAVSVAVGAKVYIKNYMFPDIRVKSPMGFTPRMTVSRYYWDMPIPVVIDFIRDLKAGEHEMAVKKRFCAYHGFRYAVVKDQWDGEGVDMALLSYEPEDRQELINSTNLLSSPRRSA